jgi:acetyl esterase
MPYAIDPELAPWVAMLPPVRYADVAATRTEFGELFAQRPPCRPARPVDIRDVTIPGPAGAPEIALRIYRPAHEEGDLAALLYIHGGGFILGDLEMPHPRAVTFAEKLDVVVVTVDYRLAPEHPFPQGLEDCYAALTWVASNGADLHIDPERLGVGGDSAGGCMTAALALLCRDRGGPAMCFQFLESPVLDDRMQTPSMSTFHDTPQLDRSNAEAIWTHYLPADVRPGSAEVSQYAAPARAEDLSGLPPAYVVICEFDPLRDEGIEYAHRLVQAGVSTELHLYPGTFHGSSIVVEADVSKRMVADRLAAVRRGLRATRVYWPRP